MKRLINAVIELLEARAENIREDTATMQLGTYARGYKDGQQDEGIYCGSDCDCDTEADNG